MFVNFCNSAKHYKAVITAATYILQENKTQLASFTYYLIRKLLCIM